MVTLRLPFGMGFIVLQNICANSSYLPCNITRLNTTLPIKRVIEPVLWDLSLPQAQQHIQNDARPIRGERSETNPNAREANNTVQLFRGNPRSN